MKFVELFAGIGGFSLGFERAGMECVGHVEIDPYAQKVLLKHWPDVPLLPDVTKVKGDEFGRVDLLCGGFPCQDLSVAGKQGGIHGKRSGLYDEIIRIAGVCRPRYIVLENVANLLSRPDWFGYVLGRLAESGYDAEWQIISAGNSDPAARNHVGAPHKRERVWIVAYPGHLRRGNDVGGNEQLCGREQPETAQRDAPQSETTGSGEKPEAVAHPISELSRGGADVGGTPDQGWGKSKARGKGVQSENRKTHSNNTESSSQDVAYSQQNGRDKSIIRENSGKTNSRGEFSRKEGGPQTAPISCSSQDVAYTQSIGVQGCGAAGQQEPQIQTRKGLLGCDSTGSGKSDGGAFPGMGGSPDGLSPWLDGTWEDGIPRVTTKTKDRANRLKCLGNALVPQIAEFIGKQIMNTTTGD